MIPSALTGQKLEAWRKRKGWSRSYVAERAGMTYGWLWRLEISEGFIPKRDAILFAAIEKEIEALQ